MSVSPLKIGFFVWDLSIGLFRKYGKISLRGLSDIWRGKTQRYTVPEREGQERGPPELGGSLHLEQTTRGRRFD